MNPVPLRGGLPEGIKDNNARSSHYQSRTWRGGRSAKSIVRTKASLHPKRKIVDSIAQNQTAVVAIPVKVLSPKGAEQVDCQINLTYQWGIIKNFPISQMMNVKLFSFDDYLQQHAIQDFGFPNPYVFDEPIDFTRNDARLLQGREAELQLVHTVFFKGERRGVPLYFHGFRKVGKTSLLNRIAI